MQYEPAKFYQDIMGSELGQVYWELGGQLFTLSSIYADCAYLFGDNSEGRVELLNKAAHRFFWKVQQTFESELMLGICRLTDPAQNMKKNNLTVMKLADLVNIGVPGAGTQVAVLAKKATALTDFARDWRNRWLAHTDYDLSVSKSEATALKLATLEKIDAALTAVDNTLKAVMSAYKFSSSGFRIISEYAAGPSLISILDEGLQARELRIERAEMGNATDEDMAFHTRRI